MKQFGPVTRSKSKGETTEQKNLKEREGEEFWLEPAAAQHQTHSHSCNASEAKRSSIAADSIAAPQGGTHSQTGAAVSSMAPLHRGESLGYKKGTVLRDGRYKVEREINRGGSAVVYLAYDMHKQDQQVALKVMDYTHDLQVLYKSVKREVAFSAHTHHPNIVRLLDVFADKQHRTLIIVWEFVQGPDLLECLNRAGGALPEPQAAFYFCQLLRGLLFMHETGFAHRDLKPENCVLQESTGIVKLIDFGLTKHIESARTLLVGTPEYMAPELVMNPHAKMGMLQYAGGSGSGSSSSLRPYDARKVDAWAMGVLFYVLVSAQYPFSDDSQPTSAMAAQRKLLQGKYRPIPASVGPGAQAIIRGLLVVNPETRMDLADVAKDPWLLASAMEYATNLNLQHMVEPPLAPSQAQVAAAAAVRSLRQPAATADAQQQQQQQPQPVLKQTVTGGTVVSTVSDADSLNTHTDAPTRSSTTSSTGSRPQVAPAAGMRTGGGSRGDVQQQRDTAGQQQQQQGYKHAATPAGASAATAGGNSGGGYGNAAQRHAGSEEAATGGSSEAAAAGCWPAGPWGKVGRGDSCVIC